MCCETIKNIPETISTWVDNGYKRVSLGCQSAYNRYIDLGALLGGLSGSVGYYAVAGPTKVAKTAANAIYDGGKVVNSELKSAAELTADFVERNWPRLLAYVAGWALIIICCGFRNGFDAGGFENISIGFKAVSIPITVGMAFGFVFGGILGVFIAKWNKPNPNSPRVEDHDWKTPPERSMFWGELNHWINSISDLATRGLLVSVSIYVVLVLAGRFPHLAGGFFGTFVGNQLITKIIYGHRLGPDPKNEQTIKSRLQELQEEIRSIQQAMEDAKKAR